MKRHSRLLIGCLPGMGYIKVLYDVGLVMYIALLSLKIVSIHETTRSIIITLFFSTLHAGSWGGLMVSAMDSGSRGKGSSDGQGHFTLTVPLFTQVYKWVPVILLLGVTQ